MRPDATPAGDPQPPQPPQSDPNIQAAALLDQARTALDEAKPQQALDLATQSLRLRHTSKAQLVEAQALQRLGRNDDAATALTAATQIDAVPPTRSA